MLQGWSNKVSNLNIYGWFCSHCPFLRPAFAYPTSSLAEMLPMQPSELVLKIAALKQ